MPRLGLPVFHVFLLLFAGLHTTFGAVVRTRVVGGNGTAGAQEVQGRPTNLAVDRKGYSYLLGDYSALNRNRMFFIDLALVSKADVQPFAAKQSPQGEILWVTDLVAMPAGGHNGTKYVASATGRYAQYVAKLDTVVGMVLWATLLSSPGGSIANADKKLPSTIVIDSTGGIVYFGGAYGPPDDDVSASGTYDLSGTPVAAYGKLDMLLAQFSAETGEIVWIRTYGGRADDAIASLAVSKKNDGVILLANSGSAVIELGDRVPTITMSRWDGAGNTVLLAVLDAKGSRRSPAGSIVVATAFGGSDEFNNGKGTCLTVDNSDDVYVLGNFNGRFNVGSDRRGRATMLQSLQANPANPSRLADTDVFLGKYSIGMSPTFKLQWAQTFGGLDQDIAGALDEGGGNVFLSVFSASKTIIMGNESPRILRGAIVLENNLAGDYATTNLATVSTNNGKMITANNELAPACTVAPGAEIDGQQTFGLDQDGYLYVWGPHYLPDMGPDAVKARTVHTSLRLCVKNVLWGPRHFLKKNERERGEDEIRELKAQGQCRCIDAYEVLNFQVSLYAIVLHIELRRHKINDKRHSRRAKMNAAGPVGAGKEKELTYAVERFFDLLQESLSASRPTDLVPVVFEIKGASSYLICREGNIEKRLPGAGEEEGKEGQVIGCRITCALPTLLGLASGRLSPSTAFLTGAVRVSGDIKKVLAGLGPFLKDATTQWMDENPDLVTYLSKGRETKGGRKGKKKNKGSRDELLLSEATASHLFVDRAEWEDDDSRSDCTFCHRSFNLSRWRHHCRMCGLLVCQSCSEERILGRRVCASCCDSLLHTYVSTHSSSGLLLGGEGEGGREGGREEEQLCTSSFSSMTGEREGGREGRGHRPSIYQLQDSQFTSSSSSHSREGVLYDLIQRRLDALQAIEIAFSPLPPPPTSSTTTSSSTSSCPSSLSSSPRQEPRRGDGNSLLLLPSLLFLALPPSLLPPALLGLYWEKALPFLHTLISSSSLTLPSSSLDTLFLHRLLLPHPYLALASAVFLCKVYFPLRWWAFRSLHINGTAAVVIATYLALNLMAKWRKLDDKEAKA
ncbi:hypothetical protein VYU27_008801, partial [Nannochloropsis oceanica]